MKVAHINFKFLDEGGRNEYVFQIVKGLSERGHESFVLSSKEITGIPLNQKRIRNLKNVKFIGLPSIPITVPSRRFFIPDLIKQLLEMDLDLIHAHGISDMTTQMALIVAKIKKVPFIVSSYFHPYWTYKEKEDSLSWQAIFGVIGKTVCSESSKIICSSHRRKRILKRNLRIIV